MDSARHAKRSGRRSADIRPLVLAACVALTATTAVAPAVAAATDSGFTIDGSVSRTWLGGAVHSAGDVNGDGHEDMIVGRHSEEGGTPAPNGVTAAIVVFGAIDLGHLTVGDMTSADGFRIWPSGESDGSGNFVDGVGDVNGDGFDDVIVASPWAFNGDRPVAHVILGRANPADVDLANFSSSDGWTITGGPEIWNGLSVAGAGDVDGDGFDDVALGFQSSALDSDLSGSVFIIRGGEDHADVDLTTETTGVTRIAGAGPLAQLGIDVASGDVNDDGYSDVVIRAGQPGAIVVVWGGPAMTDVDLAEPNPDAFAAVSAPYMIDSGAKETLAVGDINGDGNADVAYGDPQYQKDGNPYSVHGSVNILLGGSAFPSGSWKVIGADIHDAIGGWVDVRDVDSDGRADILTAAESAPGLAYLIRGRTATSDLDLSVADPSAWRSVSAPFDLAFPPIGVGLVDVTGDAQPDVLLSEPNGDPGQIGYTGRVFVVPTVDLTRPTVSAPTWFVMSGKALADGKPQVRVMWSGSDVGLGVEHYEIAESVDGGAFTTFATSTTFLHVDRSVALGHTHRFRVRAIDLAGNIGSWVAGPTSRFSAVAEWVPAVHYHGSWSTGTSTTSFWGGSTRASSAAGATASYTFTGRSITWVGLTSRTRGKAQIYVNGALTATVDLWSSTLRTKHLIWQTTFATSATRTIMIKVLGTPGRPRIDVDGFIVGT